MPTPTYVELIDEICYHIVLEIQNDFNDGDPKEYVYSSLRDWMGDTYSFSCEVQDRQDPHIKKALVKYGMADMRDDFSTKLNHDGALFVIRNSMNIHYSIDGAYRKDGYKEIALGCVHGDIVLHIAKTHNVFIDPKKVTAFNRAR